MRLFTLLLSLLSLITLAQDGINYQGVATNSSGGEISNQNISIRASVISDSTNGTLQWQETHATTTDQFGLFNIAIGQGNTTGSGLTSSFDNMNWGSSNHFLKIEMDINGGNNYSLTGITQMMSVPYAFYAKNAGEVDSVFISNIIASSGVTSRGCDFKYPEGLEGGAIHEVVTKNISYTVPSGKNLYITHLYIDNYSSYRINGNIKYYTPVSQPIILNSGDVLSSYLVPSNSGSQNVWFSGILVNTQSNISPIHEVVTKNISYTVPSGKNLYISHLYIDNYSSYRINGNIKYYTPGSQPLILSSGDILSSYLVPSNSGSQNVWIGGYLADENYFSNCNTLSTSNDLDSNTISLMINQAINNSQIMNVPSGTIQAFAGDTIPNGWLLCDGSAISRTNYSSLFSVIDTLYGSGDGSYNLQWIDSNGDGVMQASEMVNIMLTFNLPDLRGRTIVGADNMGGTHSNTVSNNNTIGNYSGAEMHILTIDQMPSHNHTFNASQIVGSLFGGTTSTNQIPRGINATISTSQIGGDQPHNNMQPYLILNYIIKY